MKKTASKPVNRKKLAMEKKPLIIALISLGAIGLLILLLIFGPGIFAGKAIHQIDTLESETSSLSHLKQAQPGKDFVMIVNANLKEESVLYSFKYYICVINNIYIYD